MSTLTRLIRATRSLLSCAAIVASASTLAQGQPTNASFESPAYGAAGRNALPTTATWTFTGTAGIERFSVNDIGTPNTGGLNGMQAAYLSSTGTVASLGKVSQDINFPAAGQYQLRFMAGRVGAANAIRVSVGGVVVDSDITPRLGGGTTTRQLESWWTVPFSVAAAGNLTVSFSATNTAATLAAGDIMWVDQVTMVALPVALPNGSFETAGSGWTLASGATNTALTTPGVSGARALVSSGTSGFNYFATSTTVTVPAGVYSLSLRIARTDPNTAACTTALSGTYAGAGPLALIPAPKETELTAYTTSSFSLPAGTYSLRLNGQCGGGVFSPVVYDGLVLNKAGPDFANTDFATPYVGASGDPNTAPPWLPPWQTNPPGATWTFVDNAIGTGYGVGIQGNATSTVTVYPRTEFGGGQFGTVWSSNSGIRQSVSLASGVYVVAVRAAYGSFKLSVNGVNQSTFMHGGILQNQSANGYRFIEVLSEPFTITTASNVQLGFEGSRFSFQYPRIVRLGDISTNSPPAVSLSLSVNGSSVTGPVAPGGTLQALATASDANGLQRIRVLRNGVPLAPESTAVAPANAASPLTVTVSPLTAGSFTYVAEATDHLGAVSTASQALIVNTPPFAQISSPAAGAAVTQVPLVIQATVSDPDAGQTITKAEFYRRVGAVDTKLGEVLNPSGNVSFTVTNPVRGAQQLFVRVFDSVGGQADSALVSIVVSGLLNGNFELPSAACSGSSCLGNTWRFLERSGAVSNAASVVPTGVGTCSLGGGTASLQLAVGTSANTSGRVEQDVYLLPGTYDLKLKARTQNVSRTDTLNVSIGTFTANAFVISPIDFALERTVTPAGGFAVSTAGNYTLRIEASNSTNGSTYVVCVDDVKLSLRNATPTITTFTSTPSGVQQAPATSVSVSATASDPDSSGYVSTIEFLVNGASASPALICTNSTTTPVKPFTCSKTWTGAAAGTNYSLTSRATDNQGATVTSSVVSVVFNRPPTATFTNPIANAQLGGPNATVPLTVTVSDPDGAASPITKVEFYTNNGATLLGTVNTLQAANTASTPPQPAQSGNVYVFNTQPLAAGSYTITARAYDSRGGSTAAPGTAQSFTVKSTNNAPTITLATVPLNIANVAFNTPVNLTATATDTDSAIGSIIITDTLSGPPTTLATCPYVSAIVPCLATLPAGALPGNHTLTATAKDIAGNVTGSTSIMVSIAPQPMTCTLTIAPTPPSIGSVSTLEAKCTGTGPVGGATYTWSGNATCAPQTVSAGVNFGTCGFTAANTNLVSFTVQVSKPGYVTTSQTLNNIVPVVNPAPKFASIAPTTTSLIKGTPITVTAGVTDNLAVSAVTRSVTYNGVAVTIDSQSCTGLTSAAANCSVTWTPTNAGIYTVSFTATDDSNAQTVGTTTVAVGDTAGSGVPALPATLATAAIGATAGQFAVSDSGAATYSIPIAVAPGVNGVQPNLALTYNSQSSDGHMGVGWALAGLSSITRCPKTIATDGIRAPINYDNVTDPHTGNDAFCLDGQRLIPILGGVTSVACVWPVGSSSTPNNTCSAWEFRTELDSYSRIIGIGDNVVAGSAGSGPTRFRVYAKSGQILEYGSRWWGVGASRPSPTTSLIVNPGFDDTALWNSTWVSHPLFGPTLGAFKLHTEASSNGWVFSAGINPGTQQPWPYNSAAGVQANNSAWSQYGPYTTANAVTGVAQTAMIQGRGVMATDSTYLEAGKYKLTFKMGGRGTSGTGFGGNQTVALSFDGNAFQMGCDANPATVSSSFLSNTGDPFTTRTVLFEVCQSGWHTITFAGQAPIVGGVPEDQTALIDDIALVPANSDIYSVKVFPLDRVEDRNGNYMHVDYGGSHQEIDDTDVFGNPIIVNGIQQKYSTVTSSYGTAQITLNTMAAARNTVIVAQGARPELEMFPRRLTYGMRTATPGNGNNGSSVADIEVARVILNYEARDDITRHFDTGSGQMVMTKRLKTIRSLVGGADDTSLRTDRDNFHLNERDGVSTYGPQCTTGLESTCGTLLRTYTMEYTASPSTGRSRLNAVEECAGNGTCLPKTTFEWQESPLSLSAAGSNLQAGGSNWNELLKNGRVADVVGDGRSRIVNRRTDNTLDVCQHNGTSFTCETWTVTMPTGPDAPPDPKIDLGGSGASWHLADYTGDGIADLIVMNNTKAFACPAVFKVNGTGAVVPEMTTANAFGPCGVLPNIFPVADPNTNGLYPANVRIQERSYSKPADVDGDGRMDVLFYRGDGRFEVCRATGQTPASTPAWQCLNPGYVSVANLAYSSRFAEEELKHVVIADFNGDGRSDIAMRIAKQCVNGSGSTNSVPNGTPPGTQCQTPATGTDSAYWSVCFATGSMDVAQNSPDFLKFSCGTRSGAGVGGAVKVVPGEIKKLATYDFNGDGLADFATSVPGSGWRVCLSTGDGEFANRDANGECPVWGAPVTGAAVATMGPSGAADKTVAGDFNGDGRTDLAKWVSVKTWEICLSTGTGFNCSQYVTNVPEPANCNGDCFEAFVGDFDGNGKSDLAVNAKGTSGQLHYGINTGAMPDLMTTITNGLGAQAIVTYESMAQTNGLVYTKDPVLIAGDPNPGTMQKNEVALQSPMYVVSKSLGSTGGGKFHKATYKYNNLRADKYGRGVSGFYRRNVIDNIVVDANGNELDNANVQATGFIYNQSWPNVGRPFRVGKQVKNFSGAFVTVSTTDAFYDRRVTFSSVSLTDGGQVPDPNSPTGAMQNKYVIWEGFQTKSIQTGADLNGAAMPTTTVYTGPGAAIITVPGAVGPDEINETLANYFDLFGNPKKFVTVVESTAPNVEKWTQVVRNFYFDNGGDTSRWLLGKLQYAVTENSATGSSLDPLQTTLSTGCVSNAGTLTYSSGGAANQAGKVCRKSSFTYHGINGESCAGAVNGQVCKEVVEPDAASLTGIAKTLYQQSAYEYDAFGNRVKSTLSFYDAQGNLSTRQSQVQLQLTPFPNDTYANGLRYGKYAEVNHKLYRDENSVANSAKDLRDWRDYGSITTNPCRNVIQVTDANKNYARTTYDSFCRKVAEAAYTNDGTLVKWTTTTLDDIATTTYGTNPVRVADVNGMVLGTERYRIVTTSSDGAKSIGYYDAYARAVRARVKAFDGTTYVETNTQFDGLGRQTRVIKPSVNGLAAIDYSYDVLGRVETETVPYAVSTSAPYTVIAGTTINTVKTTYNGLTTSVVRTNSNTQNAGAGSDLTHVTTKVANAKGIVAKVDTGYLATVTTPVTSATIQTTLGYRYDAMGNLTEVTSPGANSSVVTKRMKYDVRGRQTQLADPDAGTYNYEYNGAGEQTQQSDTRVPINYVTKTSYDSFGRKVSRTETQVKFGVASLITTTWNYDCAFAKGLMCSVTYNTGVESEKVIKGTAYDKYSRPSTTTTTLLADKSFTSQIAYDGLGRPKYSVYPQATATAEPLSLETSYNSSGYAYQLKHAVSGFVYQTLSSRNNDGQINASSLASGLLTQTNSYGSDGLGRIASINVVQAATSTTLLAQSFDFDNIGNLAKRTLSAASVSRNESEFFEYDSLDRLIRTRGTNNGVNLADAGYYSIDAAGNIVNKGSTSAGTTASGGVLMGHTSLGNRLCTIGTQSSTNCNVLYDGNGNITQYTRPTAVQAPNLGAAADGATLTLENYTAFNLPTQITKTASTGTASAEFFYDAGHQRVRHIRRTGTVQTGSVVDETLYIVPGSFEIKRNASGAVISSTATVSGFDGVVASVTTNYDTTTGLPVIGTAPGVGASTSTVSGLNTITKVLLKDHLGSMVAAITIVGTGTNPTVLATNGLTVHGFGPWGNARNAANPLNADNRGFTGHEHLTDLGIIHMNGRLYDPVMGRFLQADPIIQAPQNAQSHNRYSYVLNNPLSFIDPSGFSAWTKWRSQVVAAVAWVATMFLSGGQVQIANAVANAVRAGMDAHSSGSNVWRAIGASLVASTLNAYGVPSTITAGVETALNGGNRRQIAASMVGAEIGALFGGMGNGFVGAAAGGCASALVNRSSCWAGARDGMIAAGIGIARQAAYEYVASSGIKNAVAGGGPSTKPSSNGAALARFERELNNVWDAMKTLPEIKAINEKYGPLVIVAISSGDTGVLPYTKTLQVNPEIFTSVEYKTKEPDSWNGLAPAEWDRRSAAMPEYYAFSPMRVLAHEVVHLMHPTGAGWTVGADRYEAEAIKFENMIINKYFDANEPARRDHRSWRSK